MGHVLYALMLVAAIVVLRGGWLGFGVAAAIVVAMMARGER